MENIDEDKHLQLLDVQGIPLSQNNNRTKNIIFSHKDKSLIYNLGSNIVLYNLKKNLKTFLQYFSSDILSIKYVQDDLNILVIISDNKPFPILSIWKIPSFQGIFTQELIFNNNFRFDNVYIEQLNTYTLIILIMNKTETEHHLYVLNILNDFKFEINFFGKIRNILPKIIDFGCFFRNNEIVFLMKHNLQIYSLDLFKAKNTLKKNINFSFKLKSNSLDICKIMNFLSILTEKGNCLIYDDNGNNTSNLNPIGQEMFISSHFCEKNLCLSTSKGNIYVYNIFGFILKYMINGEDILSIKRLSLINNINFNIKYSAEDKIIIKCSVDEKNDQLFCLFQNNSFLFLSINQLLENTQFRYNIKSENFNNKSLYSFNHSNKIFDICLKSYNNQNYNHNKQKENIFYTCAKDNKLILYKIEQSDDKIKNLYYDLKNILSLSKATNNSSHYITSMQIHPIYSHKLFLGDNKGFLYKIYLNTELINEYKKFNIDSYSIIYLSFSSNGLLLFIGLETGKQLIYKMNKSFECILKLTEHYLTYDEIIFRKNNNHIISYGYFFSDKNHRHCLLYKKNNYILEYDKLFKNERGPLVIKKKILDIIFNYPILDLVMHKSENYVIVLDERRQILINNINENKITAIIDLTSQVNYIYNIQIDISGLYLAVICDIKLHNNNKYIKSKNDLLIIDINSSKLKNFIIQNSPMSKAVFDNEGKYIIIGGEAGEISLWRLPGEISSNIKNLLEEINNNESFWDNYEIKYGKFLPYNKDKNIDDDITLTSLPNDLNNNIENDSKLNDISDVINNDDKADDDNILDEIENNYNLKFDFDRNKAYKNKHHQSKSMNMRIKNPKYNLRNQLIKKGLQTNYGNDNYKFDNLKENGMPKMNINYKGKVNNNNYFNNSMDNLNIKNNIRYNFWTKNDTIKIKNSINYIGNHKYPEPKDIDDYLL